MRYVLTESSESLVPLDSEIKYLNQYIDLQQLRLTEKVEVQMDHYWQYRVVSYLAFAFYHVYRKRISVWRKHFGRVANFYFTRSCRR